MRMRPAMGMGAAMMVVWGLVYAFPVFVLPMSAELHADRAALAGIVVAILFWTAVIGPPLGALVDRAGPRPALVVGIGLSSVGFALFGQVQELWQAYVAFAGILGTGQALVYLGANVLIGRHFAGKRATAYGIAYAGLGLGTGLYAIVAQVLVDELGWRAATLALAATPILILPGVLRLHPREAAPGDEPAGEPAGEPAALSDAAVPDAAVGAGTIGVFVLVFLSSVALGLVDEGIYQNLLPHAVSVGFGATVAAVALGVVSFAYVGGQLIGGPLVDRWGAARGTLVGFVAAGLGMAAVVLAGARLPAPDAWLMVGTALYGAGLAVLLLIRLSTFADRFAGPRFGFLSGIFALAYPIGGSAVAWFGGYAYDTWGDYLPAFGVSAAGLVLATVALLAVARR